MHTGYNDAPINDLKDDLFGVNSYVKGLCKFVLECETPMTISIQGDWGSGKTSMMNMIQNELGEKIFPIWFNTWQFSQFQLGNSLSISMLEVLLKKLDGDTKILTGIAHGMFDVAKLFSLAAVEVSAGSMMKDKLNDFIKGYSEKNCVQEISELKNKFADAIIGKIKAPIERVVVFVDDLDRLEPAKAVELLEVLKLFIDCKDCVFVLTIDYEVVTLGIRQKYGSDINAAKGKSFFDKIIQLPFKMPVTSYDIEKYTKSMMNKMQIEGQSEINVDLFSSLIKTSVGLNPRGMKRLFNTYQLLYNIISDKIKNNRSEQGIQKLYNDIRDKVTLQRILFAVVCMQISFGAVYDYLLAGNLDTVTLKNLATIEKKSVKNFIRQRALSETSDDEHFEDDILTSIFRSEISVEELRETLQKLPTFINYFVVAIKTGTSDELSDKDVDYLRNILKRSAVTSVKSADQSEAVQRAFDLRQKNRERAQIINKLLAKKHLGEFNLLQDTRTSEIVSTLAAGYRIYTCKRDNKKYQLRYVLDYTSEAKISLSIYLNGCEQDKNAFYGAMGENPLDYHKNLPKKHSKQPWYFYDDIFIADDDNSDIAEAFAEKISDAYKKLTIKLGVDDLN